MSSKDHTCFYRDSIWDFLGGVPSSALFTDAFENLKKKYELVSGEEILPKYSRHQKDGVLFDLGKDREFDRYVFFGNASCVQESYRVHQLLDAAFSCMADLQQPPYMSTTPWSEEDEAEYRAWREETEKRRNILVKDICMAITGIEWKPNDEEF